MKSSIRNRALAERYASALVDSLPKVEAVDGAVKELELLVAAIDASPDLLQILSNPVFAGDRADIVADVISKLKTSELVRRFVALLVERNRMLILPEIISSMKSLLRERTGRIEVEVTCAQELSEDQQKALMVKLAAMTQKAEDALDLTVEVDPSLWGGLRAKIGSVVYDASLRSQLEQVASKLRKEI